MNIITKMKQKINLLEVVLGKISAIEDKTSKIQLSLGRIESRQLESLDKSDFKSNEFQVFSQWGEDGIIQFLIKNIDIKRKIFVEFGVENYIESNTRFLLINNNWSGLVLDGSIENINHIKQDPIYWRHNLKVVQAFIDKENINNLLLENGIEGEIGLLSIDIDGNDYWVWEAIDVISPAIVIIEYNSRFGKDKAVSIPYDPNFVRSKAHYSMLYAGASLRAICNLGKVKSYSFVGSNSAGNNAFFVRSDLRPCNIKELTPEEGYVVSQFRESRDQQGNLNYLSHHEVERILLQLPVIELDEP